MKQLFSILLLALPLLASAQYKPTPAADRLAAHQARKNMQGHSLLAQMEAQSIGPSIFSCRVTDVDANPADPTEMYVAYASGGLWYSHSNGTRFEPVFDHEASMTIGDIAVDWDRRVIWVGTGENNSSRSSYAGAGLYRSADGGKTWGERLPTPKSWATSKETPTIHRVLDAKGTKRLILFSGLYPIRQSVSEDDGNTWTELKPIGSYGGIVAMGSVVPTNKPGEYLAFFHDDGRYFREKPAPREKTDPVRFTLYQTKSTDGGLTWGEPVVIQTDTEYHLCEPGAVFSPEGKQLALLLRENRRKHNSCLMTSDDMGVTWSKPKELPGSLTGDRHTAKYAPDGRLFITFRDMALETTTKGDWVAWVGKYDDLLNTKEGQYRVRLMDNTDSFDCAYPGLELLPDGTFVTTTYGHWSKGEKPYIMSVRLKLDELDSMAKKVKKPY
jgi:hypothetical protein